MRTARRELLTVLGLVALLPGCATVGAGAAGRAAAAGLAAGTGGTCYHAGTGARLARRRLLEQMLRAPIVLLGEVHDNLAHHRIRAGLLLDWVCGRPGRPAAVVFEHLDREHNDALRLAQKRPKRAPGGAGGAGRAGAAGRVAGACGEAQGAAVAELLDAARFDRQAWQWPAHQPLFEAAQAAGATWIAANLSRASARRLSRHPQADVDPALQAMLESARWSEQAGQALAQALQQGHCGALPDAAVPGVARIQRLRDAALALPLLDASERRTVLLAGNGHVRRDYGVPRYLGALEYEALVIGFEEVPGDAAAPRLGDVVGAGRAQAFAGAYDFVCLTTGRRTDDPCTQLRPASRPVPAAAALISPAAPTRTPSR